MIIFYTKTSIFVLKKDFFVENIATLNVYQYELALSNFKSFDKVDYLGENIYLISHRNIYSLF